MISGRSVLLYTPDLRLYLPPPPKKTAYNYEIFLFHFLPLNTRQGIIVYAAFDVFEILILYQTRKYFVNISLQLT